MERGLPGEGKGNYFFCNKKPGRPPPFHPLVDQFLDRTQRVPNKPIKFICLPGCPPGKQSVDGRLNDEFLCVSGINTPAVEDGNISSGFAKDLVQTGFDHLVHFFGIIRGGRSPINPYGPYRFIGNPDFWNL